MSTDQPQRASWVAAVLIGLTVAAVGAGLYAAVERPTEHTPTYTGEHRLAGADLKYYRIVVERVGQGENYYDVAREQLPAWGFPINSPFNWRLPTYAYLLGALPGPEWIRAVVALIGFAGLGLCLAAEFRDIDFVPACGTGLLLLGVATWPLAGDAFLAQEVWAGMLILLSVGAAGCAPYSPRWRVVAVAAGLLALFFRELVLPYCLFAGVLAFWYGRRIEGAVWLAGVALFFAYLRWHGQQVAQQLPPGEQGGGLGMAAWVQFGGLGFDLMATRMNAFVMPLPGWAILLYLLLALIGLLAWEGERGRLLALTTVAYLFAYAVIGRSMNFNWGLMFAALLPFGVVRAPAALRAVVRNWSGEADSPVGSGAA